MAEHRRTISIPHRPDNVFDLVADIARYPDFIPWIKAMRVSEEAGDPAGVRTYRGEAVVGFKGFRERFATDVEADRTGLRVKTALVRGPFRTLNNRWTFQPRADGACDIDFHIEYEFKNVILQALLRANFDLAVTRLVKAFSDEADRRHPRVSSFAPG